MNCSSCGQPLQPVCDGEITVRVACKCEEKHKCSKRACVEIAKYVRLSPEGDEVLEYRCVSHGYASLFEEATESILVDVKEDTVANDRMDVVDEAMVLEDDKTDCRILLCLGCNKKHKGSSRVRIRTQTSFLSVCGKCQNTSYRIE